MLGTDRVLVGLPAPSLALRVVAAAGRARNGVLVLAVVLLPRTYDYTGHAQSTVQHGMRRVKGSSAPTGARGPWPWALDAGLVEGRRG